MLRISPIILPTALVCALLACQPATQENAFTPELPAEAYANWNTYLGDKTSSQYSSLDQLTPDNVNQLEVAWSYTSGDKDPGNRSQIQCNPIIVDGVLYASSPGLKIFALDAATGKEIWKHDPFAGQNEEASPMGVNRGVVYWEDGNDKRILFTAGPFLRAIDATTGAPILSFGNQGKVDLHDGLGRDVPDLFINANTPGIIYKDLLIQGCRASERSPAIPGHIRAYNVRTGEMAWIFHTIPHPGEYGHDTWPEGAWETAGAANSWAGFSLDEQRGWVFVPTGSAAFDFYGGDRKGENLFANSILCLNAQTGERIWHYQTVHHDVWDRDLPCPPNLVRVRKNGTPIDAVAQVTKSGYIFLFNRETGEPLYPIEERPFPPSDLKGEETWPTQPIPTRPPPFARQELAEADITDISPEAHDYVAAILAKVRSAGQFVPPSIEGTVIFPGFDGGGEWGGSAVDPYTQVLYVNANEMPWILTMVELDESDEDQGVRTGRSLYARQCIGCHGPDRKGNQQQGIASLIGVQDRLTIQQIREVLNGGRGMMPAFRHLNNTEKDQLIAYLTGTAEEVIQDEHAGKTEVKSGESPYAHTGYNRFLDEEGYPAVKPPWGTLNAIDLSEGKILWSVPLGEFEVLTKRGIPQTGTENYGGPVVTAGGLIFIGASKDEKFRAFDKLTGATLWETQLPAGGYATPATYSVNGRQFVVIAAGGGKMGTPSGDTYVAFALPTSK
jgi:quinoprotein glucose dehydrogenase